MSSVFGEFIYIMSLCGDYTRKHGEFSQIHAVFICFTSFRIVFHSFWCRMMCFVCETMYSALFSVITTWFKPTPDLEIGEIGLFVVNGDGFIKQYQGDHLHSLNPEYDDIQLSEFDESRTVGRVLGVVEESDYPTREEQAVLAEIQREKKK